MSPAETPERIAILVLSRGNAVKLTPRRVTALNGRIEGGHAGHVAGDDASSRPTRAHEHEHALVPGVLVQPPGRRHRHGPALLVRGCERA